VDSEQAQELLTALSEVSDCELQEEESDEASWMLSFGGTAVAVELESQGAVLRLIGEIGLEPGRADEVLSNPELCRGMLRFNGDRRTDAIWLGFQPEGTSFVLTRQLVADGLTETDLAAHLEGFVAYYDAWFEVAESTLATSGAPSGTVAPLTFQPELKV